MNDERRPTLEQIGARLERLPQEVPVGSDLWPEIEHAIAHTPLDDRLAALARDAEPQSDLWPTIEARIRAAERTVDSRGTHRWQTGALLAACISAVAIAALFVIDRPLLDGGPGPSPQPTQAADSVSPDAVIEALFANNSSGASAQTAAVYREHIQLVRDQRNDIEASMREYPNDAALRTLWQHAFATEMQLIDEAERVLTNI